MLLQVKKMVRSLRNRVEILHLEIEASGKFEGIELRSKISWGN
jgi:hypothetical protein